MTISRNTKISIQKELECMNEAINEWHSKKTTDERKQVIWHELSARVWAAIYLIQFADSERKPENYEEIVTEAKRYDGIDYEETEIKRSTH
jgi:hypothetical protein